MRPEGFFLNKLTREDFEVKPLTVEQIKIRQDMERNYKISQGVEELLKMDYDEFITRWKYYKGSPYWDSLKRQRKRKAGSICEICQNTGFELEMHHDSYPDFPFSVFDCVDNVRVLCRECHDLFYRNNPYLCWTKSAFIEMQYRYIDFKPIEGFERLNVKYSLLY